MRYTLPPYVRTAAPKSALGLRAAGHSRPVADRQKALAENPGSKQAADAVKALDDKAALVQGGTRAELGFGPLNRELARLAVMVESGDARPAAALELAADQYCRQLAKRVAEWREQNQAIAPVNALLETYHLSPLPVTSSVPADLTCHE